MLCCHGESGTAVGRCHPPSPPPASLRGHPWGPITTAGDRLHPQPRGSAVLWGWMRPFHPPSLLPWAGDTGVRLLLPLGTALWVAEGHHLCWQPGPAGDAAPRDRPGKGLREGTSLGHLSLAAPWEGLVAQPRRGAGDRPPLWPRETVTRRGKAFNDGAQPGTARLRRASPECHRDLCPHPGTEETAGEIQRRRRQRDGESLAARGARSRPPPPPPCHHVPLSVAVGQPQ